MSETPECANCKRLKLWAETARDLQIERDDLRVMWERESTALGAAIGQRDRISAIAEDNRGRYVAVERERDELREALQAAMLECDHLILRWPSNPYEWQIGVSRIQENIRIVLARLARIDGRVT
jgi:hypothetical protein